MLYAYDKEIEGNKTEDWNDEIEEEKYESDFDGITGVCHRVHGSMHWGQRIEKSSSGVIILLILLDSLPFCHTYSLERSIVDCLWFWSGYFHPQHHP